jgi:hypothetical protein
MTCRHCHAAHTYDPADGYCCELQYAHGDSLPGDLPDATIEALAVEAAYVERCEAFAWKMALRLAGGDAWVCERLGWAL